MRRGLSPAGEITEPAADWTTDGDHLSLSAAAGNWITLTICLCCTCIPLLFCYLCHVCVYVCGDSFRLPLLNVWNPPDLLYGCTRTDLTMLHLQDITSFMVCHMTVKRLRPQLRFRDMRWCMEALVWLFSWKWYSLDFGIEHGLRYPCIILKLDPQDQTL